MLIGSNKIFQDYEYFLKKHRDLIGREKKRTQQGTIQSCNLALLHFGCNIALALFTRIVSLSRQLQRLNATASPQTGKSPETNCPPSLFFFLWRRLPQNMNSTFSKLSDKLNAQSKKNADRALAPNTTANTNLDKKTTSNTSGPIKRKRNDDSLASRSLMWQFNP